MSKTLPWYILLLIVLLSTSILITTTEGFTTSASSFEKDISNKSQVLVLFYIDSCGYCKDLKPQWEGAETQLPELLTMVDCSKPDTDPNAKKIVEKYKITSFPRMAFFNNGVIQEDYEGPRTTEDIVNYVRSKTRSENKNDNIMGKLF
jgi:thiol-disulfide isomerase/thioredoxin